MLAEAGRPGVTIPAVRLPRLFAPLADRIIPRILARIVLNPLQRMKTGEIATMQRAIDAFDEQSARELARMLADNTTWQCPTLVRVKGQELCADREFEADPDLGFLGSSTRDRWFDAAKKFRRRFSAGQRETFAAQYAEQLRLVKIFDEEGVPLLAGTDAVGAVWVVPGASLHREFEELSAAGLSALRVLQLATLDAARFLERAGLGQVAPGFRADLVLLEQNPLDDALNLRSIAGVVRDGRYSSSDDLIALHTRLVRQGVES